MKNDDIDLRAVPQTLGLTDATAVSPVHGGSDTVIWQVERAGETYAFLCLGRCSNGA
jgi:hypothetical protein